MKIVFFNHKGGVSKTTTTYNIGWMLGLLGKKVLLVDADPQCNLSGLVLGDNFDSYYSEALTKNHNIKDGVSVAFGGKPRPIEAVECYFPPRNKNLFLLAGHANLSEYDASLSLAQNSNNAISALQNLPGAFNELIRKTSEKYDVDFVLIDLNPGLSAINQNLFILSDAFLVPTNPDPFSIMALDTLSVVLPKWVEWADRMRDLFADAAYPLSSSRPRFIGGLIQRFNIRKGKAAAPYRENINEIKEIMQNKLAPSFSRSGMLFQADVYERAGVSVDFCIAEIPDFQGLLPKAYDVGAPVFDIKDEELGETGQVKTDLIAKRNRFYDDFKQIAKQLISIKDNANSN